MRSALRRETGRSLGVPGQPGLHSKPCLNNIKQTERKGEGWREGGREEEGRDRQTERAKNAYHKEKSQCEHIHVISCRVKKNGPLSVSSVLVTLPVLSDKIPKKKQLKR